MKDKKYFYWGLVLFALIFLAHILIVNIKFLSPSEIFDGEMINNFDYGIHYYDVKKGVEFLNQGSFSGYDPNFMAGYEKGLIDDVSSKFWIFFVWIFSGLGLLAAYKLFIYLALVLMPFIFYRTLKVFGLNSVVAALGMAIAVLYQNSFKMGNFLWVGMITFPLAVYLSFWALSYLYRYIQLSSKADLIKFAIVGGIALFNHIFAVIILGLPALILWILYLPKLDFKKHLQIFFAGIFIILMNLPWLLPFFSNLNLKDPEYLSMFFQVPPFYQSVQELFTPWVPDYFHPLNIRLFIWIAGFIALIFMILKKRFRQLIFVSSCVLIFSVITYIPIDALNQLQPYRFHVVIDLILLMATLSLLKGDKAKLISIVFASFLSFVLLISSSFQPLTRALNVERILSTDNHEIEELAAFLKPMELEGRILFENDHSFNAIRLQELLSADRKLEMIGGPYRYIFLNSNTADFSSDSLFGVTPNIITEREFQAGLRLYDVDLAICYSEDSCNKFESFKDSLMPFDKIGRYKIYATRLLACPNGECPL